jgi:hypothetical protein
MAKHEPESDFKMTYTTYYVLKKGNSIWGTPTGDKCHFHTPDEIKTLYEIEKKHPEWRVEKHYYSVPVRV